MHHNGNPKIKASDTTFLQPVIFLIQYIFLLIGAKIYEKLGIKISIVISGINIAIGYLILCLIKNYYFVLVGMGFFGLGIGLGHLPSIKNSIKYFIKNQGFVNGIISGAQPLSCFVLSLIADFVIVNPKKLKADKNGIYPKEVADNFIKLLIVLSILIAVLIILSFSFSFEYKNEDELVEDEYGSIKKVDQSVDSIDINNNNNDIYSDNVSYIEADNQVTLFKKAFLTLKNLQLAIFCFCGICNIYK